VTPDKRLRGSGPFRIPSVWFRYPPVGLRKYNFFLSLLFISFQAFNVPLCLKDVFLTILKMGRFAPPDPILPCRCGSPFPIPSRFFYLFVPCCPATDCPPPLFDHLNPTAERTAFPFWLNPYSPTRFPSTIPPRAPHSTSLPSSTFSHPYIISPFKPRTMFLLIEVVVS